MGWSPRILRDTRKKDDFIIFIECYKLDPNRFLGMMYYGKRYARRLLAFDKSIYYTVPTHLVIFIEDDVLPFFKKSFLFMTVSTVLLRGFIGITIDLKLHLH